MHDSQTKMSLPRIGVRIPACAPIAQVAELVVQVERLGFDSAGCRIRN
jgi:hypothetical protein